MAQRRTLHSNPYNDSANYYGRLTKFSRHTLGLLALSSSLTSQRRIGLNWPDFNDSSTYSVARLGCSAQTPAAKSWHHIMFLGHLNKYTCLASPGARSFFGGPPPIVFFWCWLCFVMFDRSHKEIDSTVNNFVFLFLSNRSMWTAAGTPELFHRILHLLRAWFRLRFLW